MKALDCCAGAGGLSLGLLRAGFDVFGVELDEQACETHRLNVGPCDQASLWDYSPREEYDLVAGGVPCQSFSIAGKRKSTCDPRGQLYVPFLRIAQEANARAVLIENVRGMLSSRSDTHGLAVLEIEDAVIKAGFAHVTHAVLNAVDYGVPQKRQRLFIVGFRSEEDRERFSWPLATHAENGGGLFGFKKWGTVRDALKLGDAQFLKGRTAEAEANGWWNGGRFINVDQPSYTVMTRNNGDLIKPEILDKPSATVSAGLADRPSTTVDTGRLSAAGHHTTNKHGAARVIVDQLRALQAFPEGFTFVGTITQQHKQVGNAVPPPLAEAIGRCLGLARRTTRRY